jgi:hypothetical protein
MLESIDKGKAEIKSPTIKRGIKERMHRLKACDKTLRKTRKKKTKEKKKEKRKNIVKVYVCVCICFMDVYIFMIKLQRLKKNLIF